MTVKAARKCEQVMCVMYAHCPFAHIVKECRQALSAIIESHDVEEIE